MLFLIAVLSSSLTLPHGVILSFMLKETRVPGENQRYFVNRFHEESHKVLSVGGSRS